MTCMSKVIHIRSPPYDHHRQAKLSTILMITVAPKHAKPGTRLLHCATFKHAAFIERMLLRTDHPGETLLAPCASLARHGLEKGWKALLLLLFVIACAAGCDATDGPHTSSESSPDSQVPKFFAPAVKLTCLPAFGPSHLLKTRLS